MKNFIFQNSTDSIDTYLESYKVKASNVNLKWVQSTRTLVKHW